MTKPWLTEPDRVEFEYKGYPCLIVRNQMGALCGYAAVNPEHPLHGKDLWIENELKVHGGVTFSDFCMKDGPVCHTPKPGQPDNVFWIGFDCAHAWDLVPRMDEIQKELEFRSPALKKFNDQLRSLHTFPPKQYRTIEFVT